MLSIISHTPQPHEKAEYIGKILSFNDSKSLLPEQNFLQKGKPTLVLDLDHTLVQSGFQDMGSHDSVLDVVRNGTMAKIYLCKRPGLDQFLQAVAQYYELVVFTAAERYYAEAAIDEIDPLGLICHRLFRDSCTKGSSVKDLSKLGRDMQRVLIVDDNPCSFILNPSNGLQISPFYSDDRDEDRELFHLSQLLCSAAVCSDVISAVTLWNNSASIQSFAYRGFGF